MLGFLIWAYIND